jgi:beta-mannosidase
MGLVRVDALDRLPMLISSRGPAFSPTGPWQPAYVVQLADPGIYVHNSLFDIYREGQLPLLLPNQTAPWIVNASFDYVGPKPSDAGLKYTLRDLNNRTVSSGVLENVNVTENTITGSVSLPDGSVELWWPSGLGPQNLYYITVEATGVSACSNASVTKRTAFRTIVLNEFPITDEQLSQGIAPGNNWHFEINGKEFYAKVGRIGA